MKITKETTREYILDNLPTNIIAILSNWNEVQCYRSTLYAYLQRWYYRNQDDKIERAIIL